MAEDVRKRVGSFLLGLDPRFRPLAETLRRLILEAAPVEETIKWSYPTYVRNGNVCSLNHHKDYLRLQFFRGAELSDPTGLLEGAGKGMRHLKVRSQEDIQPDVIQAWVLEAVSLNER